MFQDSYSETTIIDHVLITLLGWLVGVITGTALGYGLAILSNKFRPPKRNSALLIMLIPWRTLLVGLLLLNFFPLIPTRFLGLGSEAGIVSVAFALFVISVALTVHTLRSLPETTPFIIRSFPWIRSLATFSALLSLHYGTQGGGGLGLSFVQFVNLLDYQRVFIIGVWVVGITLAFDLITGGLEYLIRSRYEPKNVTA